MPDLGQYMLLAGIAGIALGVVLGVLDPTLWVLGGALLISLVGLIGWIGWHLNRVPQPPHKGPPPVVDATDLTDDQLAAMISELQAVQRERGHA